MSHTLPHASIYTLTHIYILFTLARFQELHAPSVFLVFLNGLLVGIHRQPDVFTARLRAQRRSGHIGEFVSVFSHEQHKAVYIATDGGRVCRPLVIVDARTRLPRVTAQHLSDLEANLRDFDSFLGDNAVEYVDVNEENNCLVALRDADIGPHTTHVEIDPMTILGVVTGLIPYPHHNQSPRNTYQVRERERERECAVNALIHALPLHMPLSMYT